MRSNNIYYAISIIEGACLMATELLGAKMLAPFFGSSLYVWSTVLAMTLGGLAIGYFVGGYISNKYKSANVLWYILLIGSFFTMLMPYTSKAILLLLTESGLLFSVILSSFLFLFPPIFMMGMVSPIIISKITSSKEESGKASGSIYAVSTTGGILSTFLTGFYVIPNYGLSIPCIINGAILGIIPLYFLVRKNKVWLLLIPVVPVLIINSLAKKKNRSDVRIVFESEGLLGQILVTDEPNYLSDTGWAYDGFTRVMHYNRTAQTTLNLKTGEVLNYVKTFKEIISGIKDKNTMLVLGLGGGSIASEFYKLGYEVDACELDKRVAFAARKYFFLDPKINVIIDDARHYIRSCNKKYDIIIYDVFKAEENPSHVFTKESLSEAKKILSPNGVILVNGNGFFTGKVGKGMRSLYKTLIEAGFQVSVLPSPTFEQKEEGRNLIFVASENKNEIPPHSKYIVLNEKEMADAVVLKDEYPILDILNLEANRIWRENYIHNSIKLFNKRNVPLFK